MVPLKLCQSSELKQDTLAGSKRDLYTTVLGKNARQSICTQTIKPIDSTDYCAIVQNYAISFAIQSLDCISIDRIMGIIHTKLPFIDELCINTCVVVY